MKVSELTGAQLALWVARALKLHDARIHDGECLHTYEDGGWTSFAPHEDWAQGGPLLDQYDIYIGRSVFPKYGAFFASINYMEDDCAFAAEQYGTTRLEAAMRALVAKVYGAEVPDEVAA